MRTPPPMPIHWLDLPLDRRRRLAVWIGRLIRKQVEASNPEVDHERHLPGGGPDSEQDQRASS
ncbi:hypothetical protein [Azospirillum canadense]|uniref:hypothetical protein n=1 Tax=Azospirillum canadense TaxID=403962 RepID=UPI002227F1CC|nr:hypothetical protein [Azospirillum canadense]MCW2242378.1 hypothetical protein [Azospirillum canadense]